jgi:phage host-nuclease inhibitor protein Gam
VTQADNYIRRAKHAADWKEAVDAIVRALEELDREVDRLRSKVSGIRSRLDS